tara:strand:+ start:246 stop:563 length:318 start_codon:yes stop_codon:yes gene_type:complete
MGYQLANGNELSIGRESQTGLLQFLLGEEGGTLPKALSGRFTSHKYLDEAYRIYLNSTEDLRTREPLAETGAFDMTATEIEEAQAPKKERPKLKYKQPKAPKKDD